MRWVVQDNLHHERGYDALLAAIERQGLPLTRVRALPFTTKLVPADFDIPPGADVQTLPDVELDPTERIVAMGSYSLARTAEARGWTPGAWLHGLDALSSIRGWGARMLNGTQGRIQRIEDVHLDAPMFIRPAADSKAFTGQVFEPDEFTAWRTRVMALDTAAVVHAGTEVLVALPRILYSETRCFVVANQVVTASRYRQGGKVLYAEEPAGSEAVAFAEESLLHWSPRACFVLDVAETPDGWRIVETNCLNAAGFYACDVNRIVGAIEAAYG